MSLKNEALDNLSKWLDSPEGKQHAKEYFGRLNARDKMEESQVERFWAKHADNLDAVVESVIKKYRSDKYRDSWYGRGIEPPESLYYFLHEVAQKYGREFTETEYANNDGMFTHNVYVLGNWKFELIVGQGSAILVDRYKSTETDNDR